MTNLHARSDATAVGGMELAAAETIAALAQAAPEGSRVAVLAHPETSLPAGVDLIPVSLAQCPDEYNTEGEGVRKWIALATEHALYNIDVSRSGPADIVHTLSADVIGSVEVSRKLRARLIRTLHLMPWYPGYAVSADSPDWCIYVSAYQQARDRWRTRSGCSIFRHYIPVDVPSRLTRERHAISVGRVEPSKGHLEAARLAIALGMDLLVVGSICDAQYARELESIFPGRVRLVGPLSRGAALLEIARSSLLIWTPKFREPLGRVVVEAIRLATPVLGRRIGVVHDIAQSAPESLFPFESSSDEHADLVYVKPVHSRIWPSDMATCGTWHWSLYRRLAAGENDDP